MSRTRVKDGSANPNPGPCGEIVPLKEFLANSVAYVASAISDYRSTTFLSFGSP